MHQKTFTISITRFWCGSLELRTGLCKSFGRNYPRWTFSHERDNTRKAPKDSTCGIRRYLLSGLSAWFDLAVRLGVAQRRRQILLPDDLWNLCSSRCLSNRRGSKSFRASQPDLVRHLVERCARGHHGGPVHL